MEFREVVETTGTCRFYRKDAVPEDVLRRVFDGARWAPTGGNRQGVRFVLVRDAGKRRKLRDLYTAALGRGARLPRARLSEEARAPPTLRHLLRRRLRGAAVHLSASDARPAPPRDRSAMSERS
jgi:nitroreductase